MKRIALIPVYNEESTLVAVLNEVYPVVDLVIVVDDGSRDHSLKLAQDWARVNSNADVLSLRENSGMSAALREGFLHIQSRLQRGELDPEDILLTLDADGQHDCREVPSLCGFMIDEQIDVALTRRDFSLYPGYKRMGNTLMTCWARLWSGFRYDDVESGFRAMRIRVLPELLEYYSGCRYSCAQEIAILTARLGFRVDNRFRTVIQRYRSQTTPADVFINSILGLWSFLRWALGLKVVARPALARRVTSSGPL